MTPTRLLTFPGARGGNVSENGVLASIHTECRKNLGQFGWAELLKRNWKWNCKIVIYIYHGAYKFSLSISHFFGGPQTFTSYHYLTYLYFPFLSLTLNSISIIHFQSNQTGPKGHDFSPFLEEKRWGKEGENIGEGLFRNTL